MNNGFVKNLLLVSMLLPISNSYADFSIKKVEKVDECPVIKKITVETSNSNVELDTSVLSKIKKLEDSERDCFSSCNKNENKNLNIDDLLNHTKTIPKEKIISIKNFSIKKLFKDQVWLKVGNDIYIAQEGDKIGNVVIKKIDFDNKVVETSKGKIKYK